MSKWQDRMPKWKNPPTKEQRKAYFGKALIDRYVELFERRVKKQPDFAELTLHILIGQLPSIKKMRIIVGENEIDLRISGCFFKPSGSGGGRGFNFMARIAKEIESNFRIVTEITDAALIGTSDEVKGYSPEKKGMVTEKRIERGALDPRHNPPINIIAMSEADLLFSGTRSEYKKNAMLYYQIALNPMGTEDNHLAKKLGRGMWIDCYPNISLMLMSYPPDNWLVTIVKRGFLQRMIIIYNEFSTEDRIEVAKTLTNLIGVRTEKAGELEELCRRIRYVNDFWEGKENVDVTLTPKAREAFTKLVGEFFKPFRGVGEYQRKKLEEFSQRWLEHLWILAYHHMFLRLDTTLKLEDVSYAQQYLLPIWKRLVSLLEEGIEVPKDQQSKEKLFIADAYRCYQSLCKKRGVKVGTAIPRKSLMDTLAKKDWWNCSYKTSSTRFTKLLENGGWFKRIYKGTIPTVKQIKLPKWLKTSDGNWKSRQVREADDDED